ncbi:MAG: histidinol dehydrogenase, partial [Clostridia bacterium]|nr:histidinol dehydrogenase [Clostridia bacterium]
MIVEPVKYSEDVKKELVDRKTVYSDEVDGAVREILAAVKNEGDEALKRYTLKFDGTLPESFRVSDEEIEEAMSLVDEKYMQTLKNCMTNIEEFHKAQLRAGFEIKRGDCVIGQRFTPVESAGLYIPGGTAAYPSTVLMNAVPAKTAGVKRIVMATPPQKDGKIKKEVIAAARMAGVTEIYKIGGAQAIAALAYGTETVPKVDCVVGPGNVFVAVAKKQIYGTAGIDMVAGPSEILVIADEGADPENVAADLLSQAEHDVMASAILITDSMPLAETVSEALDRRVKLLDRCVIASESLKNNCRI